MSCANQILDGSYLRLYLDGVLIAKDTSTELSIENSSRETTSKISGGWKSFISGSKGFSVSGEALYISADYTGLGKTPQDLFNLLNDGTIVTAKLATPKASEGYFQGDILINSISISSGNAGDNVSFSFSAQGTGKLEFKTV
tara:strand:+ start:11512 stop:11937 length:426 start_codon:yes stop_codon:yes gene_type:complete